MTPGGKSVAMIVCLPLTAAEQLRAEAKARDMRVPILARVLLTDALARVRPLRERGSKS